MSDSRPLVLRDIPAIQELEALARKIHEHPYPDWSPHRDGWPALVEKTTRAVFGVTVSDLDDLVDEAEEGEDVETFSDGEWDALRGYVELPLAAWALFSVDVLDADGKPLLCLPALQGPLLASLEGIGGQAPEVDARPAGELESWEAALANAAAQFKARKAA